MTQGIFITVYINFPENVNTEFDTSCNVHDCLSRTVLKIINEPTLNNNTEKTFNSRDATFM